MKTARMDRRLPRVAGRPGGGRDDDMYRTWARRRAALLFFFLITGFLANVPAARATTSSCATSWSNFTGSDGFITEYTYQGTSIRDYETSQDPTNGGAAVSPTESDLASGSPGLFPGPES